MDTKRPNILFIFSDQHSKFQMGCYGNSYIHTPNIDRLADEGTRFNCAYSNNPICVPARASMVTGQYSCHLRAWDNSSPYTGQVPSFGHRLQKENIKVTTIGKLHFRNAEDDTGFPDQRIPLHIRDGQGDLYGILREARATKPKLGDVVISAGYGESSYIEYDTRITEEALNFLDEGKNTEQPWLLYLGYVLPHIPFISPKSTWDLYDENKLPLPLQYNKDERPEHDICKDHRRYMGLEEEFDEATVRKAVHAYYGMCSYLDIQIGFVMDKLKELGLDKNTIVIYSTDHGEMLGSHGMWFKNCMYEESAGIPLIIKGPGIPQNKEVDTNVSLIDIYPTILGCMGIELTDDEKKLPGTSLLSIAKNNEAIERTVFSEFHAQASLTAGYMIRSGDYKYVYYVDYKPQLFDLKNDPRELNDLSEDSKYAEVITEMDQRLRALINPEQINAVAKNEQEEKLNLNGGREVIFKTFKPVVFSPAPKID